jgi:hypothetical protein
VNAKCDLEAIRVAELASAQPAPPSIVSGETFPVYRTRSDNGVPHTDRSSKLARQPCLTSLEAAAMPAQDLRRDTTAV